MALLSRRTRSFLLRLLVTVALVAFLIGKVDFREVVSRMRHLNGIYVAGAAVLLLAQILLSGARWHLVARLLGVAIALHHAVRLALIGQFFSQALPSAVGGDAVRAWLVSRGNIGFGRALVTVACDRVIGLVMLLLIACTTLPLFLDRVDLEGPGTGLAYFYIALLFAFVLSLWIGPRLLQPFARFKIAVGLHMIVTGMRQLFRPQADSAYVLLLALTIQSCIITSVYWLAQALGMHVSIGDCFAVVPPVMLAATVPVSIAGWGVREGAMVAAFGYLGVPATEALALSLLFGITQLLLSLPGGIVWVRSGSQAHLGIRALRRSESEPTDDMGKK